MGYPQLGRRAFPLFIDTEAFQPNQEDQLKAALPDAIDLVTQVLTGYDVYKDIWLKYFPESDHAKVQNVFKRIVSDPSNPGEGEDRVSLCRISGFDMSNVNPSINPCGEEDVAYTFNWPASAISREMPEGSSFTYFCPGAYKQTPKYNQIDCNGFDDTLNDNMDFLGATILHEWLHNDQIGQAATGTHITDVDGRDGYGPYNTRQMLINQPSQCVNNADSYTWLALEVFWTSRQCFTGTQGNRFKDPVAPSCSKAKRDAGECSGSTSAIPDTLDVPSTVTITTEGSSMITPPPATIHCDTVGPSPGTGVDEPYCDCVVDGSSSTITLSIISGASAYTESCAYSTLPGSTAVDSVKTDTATWTSNCEACTLVGGVGGGQETCTTVSGCTPTAAPAKPTIISWVANVGTIDIGNADDGIDGNHKLATEMFGKLSKMCDSNGCKGDHQEMDNVEAVIADGEEPLKPAMYIDAFQYSNLDTFKQMLSVGIGSWISALNNSGLNLCHDVEYEADADETGSGCGSGPIPTRRIRRKVRRDDGAVLWERDGLAQEEKRALDERCLDNCDHPMVCHYSARMCNAPDSITVIAGTKSDPYAGHLNIGVTLDKTDNGFDCAAIAGGLTALTALIAPELLEADALEGVELESLCGIVEDPLSALDLSPTGERLTISRRHGPRLASG
ncbi:uncharacterized protein GGS22DRAFT_193446 [Annulohypoxylon maeteangense]|uniref:uncharacterized protein n=1 Tax=Annulohypoxylon maeteangense TaxID=1927788 RepID=UPI002008117F|nr:uncharacterized protein GGS22DRAFT_193446 [Annulohypoxylon maeteangense]KAI0880238.1 hypothetical protein GGS22DRAFT_193446 [Annulohypoxylon maeteangense]